MKTARLFASLLTLGLSSLALVDCASAAKTCTLIGCADSLVLDVRLVGRSSVPSDVIVVGWNDGATDRSVTCEAATGQCTSASQGVWATLQASAIQVRAPLPSADAIAVTVRASGIDLARADVTLTRSESQPNGPQCGPTCVNASGAIDADLSKAPVPLGDAGADAPAEASTCGGASCGATQVCVVPCCGGANPGDAAPCTPPPPRCVDLPAACAGAPGCACMPDACGGGGGCGGMIGGQLYCVCF